MNPTKIPRSHDRKVGKPGIGGDRLSFLSDRILSRILSFLQTKHAVGTAVLSRRWKNRWTRVSSLNLDNRLATNGDKASNQETRDLEFCRFVDRVLSEHQNLNTLKRFRIHFSLKHFKEEVSPNFWSKLELAAEESELEEIDVSFDGFDRFRHLSGMRRLPATFYALRNLKQLKLERVVIVVTEDGSVFLPSLKILELLYVETMDCESLRRLISGCPVLETAHMDTCYSNTDDKGTLTASLPYLKNLTIVGYTREFFPIAIEAPSLEHLHLRYFLGFQLLGSSQMPYLVSARVEGLISDGCLIGFLNQICNAKELCLSWETLAPLADANGDVQVSSFPNLTHLTIKSDGCRSGLLHSLLNSAPKLQSLVIDLGFNRKIFAKKWKSEPACTPKCLLYSLEEIEIQDLLLQKDDMKMVAYLLKFGAVLKKVNVYLHEEDLGRDKRGLLSLLKLPRRSRACKVQTFLLDEEFYGDSNNESDFDESDDFEDSDE